MPNQALLSILAVTITVYFGSQWVTKMINDRGDEILSGVVDGVPVSTKQRWLMLFANWLPYTVFLIAFLLVIGLGIVEIARATEEPRIRLIGYMCATVYAGGAAFWAVLGSFLFANMLSALRSTTRT